MNEPDAIALKGLSCRLGRFQLGPLDLTIPRGSITAFIGHNGAARPAPSTWSWAWGGRTPAPSRFWA